MKLCAYCGYSNPDTATDCAKCSTSLQPLPKLTFKTYRVGPEKAHDIRKMAMGYFVLGLMIKVYWGGYGTWTPYDNDVLMSLRTWVQPVLLFGGAAVYVLGWILRWV